MAQMDSALVYGLRFVLFWNGIKYGGDDINHPWFMDTDILSNTHIFRAFPRSRPSSIQNFDYSFILVAEQFRVQSV